MTEGSAPLPTLIFPPPSHGADGKFGVQETEGARVS